MVMPMSIGEDISRQMGPATLTTKKQNKDQGELVGRLEKTFKHNEPAN
jgi:hypothetical protein